MGVSRFGFPGESLHPGTQNYVTKTTVFVASNNDDFVILRLHRFNAIAECDRQTDGHTHTYAFTIAKTRLALRAVARNNDSIWPSAELTSSGRHAPVAPRPVYVRLVDLVKTRYNRRMPPHGVQSLTGIDPGAPAGTAVLVVRSSHSSAVRLLA